MLAASVVVMPVAAREHVSDERDNAEYGVENFTPGFLCVCVSGHRLKPAIVLKNVKC